MKNIFSFLIARLKERSTWLGLTSFATGLGLALKPDVAEAVIAAGIALAGLIAALTKDKT